MSTLADEGAIFCSEGSFTNSTVVHRIGKQGPEACMDVIFAWPAANDYNMSLASLH